MRMLQAFFKVVAPCVAVSCLLLVPPTHAQEPATAKSAAGALAAAPQAAGQTVASPPEVVPALPVPRLITFSGTLKDSSSQPRTGAVGLTFSIYKDQEDGSTLWMETHNVELDAQGHYSVLLGSMQSEGIPLELFATGESRWLGVKVELPGEAEQARVLLVSVPYALKASDADTLGGKPASAYALAQGVGSAGETQSGSGATGTSQTGSANGSAITRTTISGSGMLNQVAKFTPDGMTIGNSAISEVNGNVGVGVSNPMQSLVIAVPPGRTAMNMSNLVDQDMLITVSSPGAADKVGFIGPSTKTSLALGVGSAEKVRITNSGNVGIGVSQPQQRLTIAAPVGGPIINASNLADQDMFITLSAPGAADKHAFFGPGTNTNLTLGVNSTEMMRITSAGNVGIGTSTPGARLDIAAGNLNLPTTTSANVGVLTLGGTPFLHNFGANNTFVGALAGNTSMTGLGRNTGVGNFALALNTTGDDNSALGFVALNFNTTGSGNSAFGSDVLYANTTGAQNSGFGFAALQDNITGTGNSAFGSQALFSNTTASQNSAFGYFALNSNTTGGSNSAFGYGALLSNGTSSGGSAFGYGALLNSTGPSNSAFGVDALLNSTLGSGNTAVGASALQNNSTGNNNVAVGNNSGAIANSNTTGSNNTFLGAFSGPGTSGQMNNAAAIGANAMVTCSNCMVLGDSTMPMMVGIRTSAPSEALEVVGNTRITGTGNGIIFPDGTRITTGAATGGGTITGVTAGAGLTGGGNAGFVTLSVPNQGITNAMLAKNFITVESGLGLTGGQSPLLGGTVTLSIDTTVVPQLGAVSNTFTGGGGIAAASFTSTGPGFTGNGAGLTNVVAVNSTELGGMPSGAFALLGTSMNPVTENFFGTLGLQGNLSLTQPLSGPNPSLSLTDSSGDLISASGKTITLQAGGGGGALIFPSNNGGVTIGAAQSSSPAQAGNVNILGANDALGGLAGTVGLLGGDQGNPSSAATKAGSVVISGGNASVLNGAAGGVTISGGNGTGSNASAGNVSITAGLNQTTSSLGNIVLTAGSSPSATNPATTATGGVLVMADLVPMGNITSPSGITIRNSGLSLQDAAGNVAFAVDPIGDTATIGFPASTGKSVSLAVNGSAHIVSNSPGVDGNLVIDGNVNVGGTLTKAMGSFKIDHPLDPENKFLYHSFVESPDMKNIYDGTVVLDAEGGAWVELPAWFQSLNSDFRYQLTCIGGYAPVYIAQEVKENRFRIAGGKPGLKVSWQVTGIRQDAYAQKHRIQVEEQKPAADQGHYLYPDAFGLPPERGIRWAKDHLPAVTPDKKGQGLPMLAAEPKR